jgi:hypothetical protein
MLNFTIISDVSKKLQNVPAKKVFNEKVIEK